MTKNVIKNALDNILLFALTGVLDDAKEVTGESTFNQAMTYLIVSSDAIERNVK